MERNEWVFLFIILPAVAGVALGLSLSNYMFSHSNCTCTVDFNGSQVSVEDAIQLSLEGLSSDQADEVQIMINNSLGR